MENIEEKQTERYQTIKKIGHGGMGCVYKAYDSKLCRTVALKTILPHKADPHTIKRFMIEAQALSRLNHPGIVCAHDIIQKDNQCFLVMDFVEGKLLKDLVRKNTPVRQIVNIMIKIGEAVQHAHDRGIIHRDLKPSNIMLDENNMPKVMDFGVAKITNADQKLSKTGEILGTLLYMPPEQVEGKHHLIDNRSDIYSLGAILYEVLTGFPPFSGGTSHRIMYKILEHDPIPLRNYKKKIPQEIESICLKALEKKSNNRYQNATEFITDLKNFKEGKEIQAKPWGLKRRITFKIKQNRYLITTLFAIVAVLFALYLYSKIESNREQKAKVHFDNYINYYSLENKIVALEELESACKIYSDSRYFMHKAFMLYTSGEQKQITKAQQIAHQHAAKIFEYEDPLAFCTLGCMYDYGLGVKKNREKAIAYYQKAHENSIAMYNLATIYTSKKEYQKAEQLYRTLADKGIIKAMIALGNMHYYTLKNTEAAIEWYKKAGDCGNKNSYFLTGYIYYQKKEFDNAINFFFKALPSNKAMLYIGTMYQNGEGIQQNSELAEEWYKKAIDANNYIAMFNLAFMYWRHIGATKTNLQEKEDIKKAIEWYQKIVDHEKIEQEHQITAMINLGRIYSGDFAHNDFYDIDKAYYYFEETIKMGSFQASIYMANLYSKASSENKQKIDITKIVNYLQNNYEQEKIDSTKRGIAHHLGLLYKNEEIIQNFAQAIYWLRKSYDMGNRESAIEIFRVYVEDKLTPQNIPLGIEWLERVIREHNHEGAMFLLGKYYYYGWGIPQNHVQARDLFYKASTAENEHPGAMFFLGNMYLEGQGGDKNLRKAINWLEKAAKLGEPNAPELLKRLEK